ncbi:exodeoxyribonuclease V subunit beta [Gallaecimonas xiamenensis]|uniref:RecBCD enzyme subunit RecB n=1 Tax=Gallaecimonas xiamenensis 3-C-1 TaxID=745411 RepID=K2JK52_9GAMM|nr:exodeoxyribonuclease V subunit beta [Gallaecimonas xiamenensis]EKE75653.1 exodeoxyribonuclease V subunit beta [Gallaecimonas xiamenensis 3-C-1]
MSQHLNPLTFPLHGTRLIEASAGTGKTFTIAALYLRLVLQGLTPPQILVVTFTDAATKELKDRIRARLVEATKVFRGALAGDPLVAALKSQYPEDQWPGCARRLELAAQWMDEAAVYTIHGWCNRMLATHAFAADSLFELTLETDQRHLFEQVLADYWRSQYYPLADVSVVAELWNSPAKLHAAIRPWLPWAEPPVVNASEVLAELAERQQALLAPVKEQWRTLLDDFSAAMLAAHGNKDFNGNKVRIATLEGWLEALKAWVDSDALLPEISDKHWERFSPAGLEDAAKANVAIMNHPGIDALGAILAARAKLPKADIDLAKHAAGWIKARLEQEKHQRATLGFDDLLTRLDQALHKGPELADVIRRQYPIALIDEFQDTDPTQLRIFAKIYDLESNQEETGLFLIGDPKQAIYGFRGADIFTYLKARRATTGRHYHLDTNYRSTQGLVSAVNQVFGHQPNSFLFDEIPFEAVKANGRKEQLVINGAPVPAMTGWHLALDSAVSGSQYRKLMAERCASQMVAMLNGDGAFQGPDGQTPLRPADMAVLVRGRGEADAIRAALFARGVASVYLSDKESVFASSEARDLLALLAACAEPEDGRLLRAALAAPVLELSLGWLDTLNQDELLFEQQVERFKGYQLRWHQRGVLPMLRQLLSDFSIPARLLASPGGERSLTNLLHLAELLQGAAAKLDGEQALIRYLSEAVADPAAGDEEILRLESDADLVKVITIHKSKGLEYPLVFLPFVMGYREEDRQGPYIRYHDDSGKAVLDIEKTDGAYAKAEKERLAEDMRLLYVALTRPRHACFLGLAPVKMQRSGKKGENDLHRGAFGYLLTGGTPIDNGALGEAFARLAAGCSDIVLSEAPDVTDAQYQPKTQPLPLVAARPFKAPPAERWYIASYSALRTQDWQSDIATPLAENINNPDEEQEAQSKALSDSIHQFPRGPGPGTFLHGLFEWAALEGFGKVTEPQAQKLLAARLTRRGWEQWLTPLTSWFVELLNKPLALPGGEAVALGALNSYQAEMEFWFSAQQVDLQQMDMLVHRHTLGGHGRPMLSPGELNGMLKGFIDLVFEHNGRYYVLDYKSNHLGDGDSAYSQQAMADAIREKRYDLQYVIYLLALHRLLKSRIPDYDYDRHMGGAVYLFLRGGHCYLDRPQRELIEGLDAMFEGKAHA